MEYLAGKSRYRKLGFWPDFHFSDYRVNQDLAVGTLLIFLVSVGGKFVMSRQAVH
jgi:hypothetical protein